MGSKRRKRKRERKKRKRGRSYFTHAEPAYELGVVSESPVQGKVARSSTTKETCSV